MNLSPISATSNDRKSSQYAGGKEDKDYVIAQGRIVRIMHSNCSSAKKIDLIMEIFAKMIEESDLQGQCVEELEKQNKMLSKANGEMTSKQKKLTSKIADYSDEIQKLTKENGLIGDEQRRLQQKLNHLVQEKQSLIDRQNKLEKENKDLTDRVSKLSKEKDDIAKKQSLLLGQVKDLKDKETKLLQQNKEILQKRDRLDVDLEAIENQNKQLQAKIDQIDQKEAIEEVTQYNHRAMYGLATLGVGITVFTTGGLAIPLLFGGGMYAMVQSSTSNERKNLERKIENYVKIHPEASKEDIDQILDSSKRDLFVTIKAVLKGRRF